MKKHAVKIVAVSAAALFLICAASVLTFAQSTVTAAQVAAEDVVFHLLGVMPRYTDITRTVDGKTLHAYVTLPNISATFPGGNATKIVCDVTDADGLAVEVYSASDALPADYKETLVGHQFMFEATTDGTYTVVYTATRDNIAAVASYEIKAGDTTPPEFELWVGYIDGELCYRDDVIVAYLNETFDFAPIEVIGETSLAGFAYSKKLIDPYGETLAEVTDAAAKNNGSSYVFGRTGTYGVVYSVADAAGNICIARYYITVTDKPKYDMSGVGFAGETVIYDGAPHSLTVTGLPAEVSVAYENNGKTDPGTYIVIARFTIADTAYGPIRSKAAVLRIAENHLNKIPEDDMPGCGGNVGGNLIVIGVVLFLGVGGLTVGKGLKK